MDYIKNQPKALKATGSAQPEVSGFGLLGSAMIQDGKVTITPIFLNKTESIVKITFTNSHYFIVEIEDAHGGVVHFNHFLPPPLPDQAPSKLGPVKTTGSTSLLIPRSLPTPAIWRLNRQRVPIIFVSGLTVTPFGPRQA